MPTANDSAMSDHPTHAQIESKSTGTLRNALDGTVFRAPIVIENIPRYVSSRSHLDLP